MDIRTLAMRDPPTTPAWQELARLLDRRGELTAGLEQLDAEQRAAIEATTTAASHVADLERRALGGEPVTEADRMSATKALQLARTAANAPWSERRQGHAAAVADLDRHVGEFVRERFGDLADGLREQGAEAARAVDDAATRLLAAHVWREEIAGRMGALSSTITIVRAGDVSYSRAERAANEARRLLDQGGERPPDLRDPRLPRHGQAPADEEEAVPA